MKYLSFFVIIWSIFVSSISQAESIADSSLEEPAKEEPAKTAVHQWAMDRMVHFAPPGRKMGYAAAQETEKEARARYWEIIDDAIAIAYDPDEKPIVNHSYGRAMNLSIILGLAGHESGYRKDVDLNIGKHSRGDNGRSWCMNQVWMGRPTSDGTTPIRIILDADGTYHYAGRNETGGFTGQDLIRDRRNCFRVSLHIARDSWQKCSGSPVLHRLAIYTSGENCKTGLKASAIRVQTAIDWMARGKPDLDDAQMMLILHPTPQDESKDTPPSNETAFLFQNSNLFDRNRDYPSRLNFNYNG